MQRFIKQQVGESKMRKLRFSLRNKLLVKKKVIKDLEYKILVYNNKFKTQNMLSSFKVLGVYLDPTLKQKDQFKYIRNKIEKLIIKLIKTNIMVYQVCIYFNIYIIINIFHSCRLLIFNNRQLQDLKNIYKIPIIKKLDLSKKN